MKAYALKIAIAEATRFIDKAMGCVFDERDEYVERGPASAAIKRASLDLTKALANIRKRNS